MKRNRPTGILNSSRSPAGLIIVLSLILLAACQGPFDLTTALGLDTEVLSVSPNGAAIADNVTQLFTVSGGTAPYIWSVYAGPGAIDATGIYTPGVIGVATIKVVDSEGLSGKATMTIIDAALLLPLNLLAGTTTLETGDSITLFATGGDAPYTFDIPTNNSGASITPAGGFYTAGIGAGVDTVRVTDNLGANATVNITVTDTPATIPDVDYRPITINVIAPAVIGGAITADFMYENIGTDNGGTPVSWSAYVSTTPDLSGVVSLANSGTVPALNAGTVSGSSQNIGGSWPADGGNYYIVVHLAAESDVNPSNNVAASVNVNITVDYHPTALPAGTGILAGGPLLVNFDLSNQGTVAGASNVEWYAYISTNSGLGAGDTLIDDGSFGALPGSDTLAQTVTVSNNWPSAPGTYYIILEWVSVDDPAGYKETASGAFAVSLPDVDYGPGVVIPPGGPIVVGSGNTMEIFRIENIGTDDGSDMISWDAWLSIDATPGNAGDIHADSGTIPGGIPAFMDSGNLTANVDWAVPEADYNLIITWSAADDINNANNELFSSSPYIARYADIDYGPVTVPTPAGSPLTGSTVSETFDIMNFGTEDGTQNLEWSAWASLDGFLNAGDIQIDSGTLVGGLVSGIPTGPIPISGVWPEAPGNYYILVTLLASEDNNLVDNLLVSPGTAAVRLPVYDYAITSVPAPGGSLNAGDIVNGFFDVQNLGGDNDTTDGFTWAVYASTDPVFSPGDILIETRTDGAPQIAMDPPLTVNYSGFWPDIGGDFYIVAVIGSGYDPAPANDEMPTAAPVPVVNVTDYEISVVNYHPIGLPGSPLNAAPTPWTDPGYIPYDFLITEIGGVAGTKNVDYTVYVSSDTILDGADSVLKSGIVPAGNIGAGGNELVPFDDGNNWPAFPKNYYIIVTINAADDLNAANDYSVSGPVEVAAYPPDSDGNDAFGPFPTMPIPLPPDVVDMTPSLPTSQLRVDEFIRVDGVLELNNGYDTYKFQAGPGMTTVYLELTWLSGTDAADMYLWDEADQSVNMIDITADIEGPTRVVPIIPFEIIYIGVKCLPGNTGVDYTLRIRGEP